MRAAGPIQKFYWHNVPLAAEKVTRGLPVSSFNFLNLVGLGGFEPPTSSLGNFSPYPKFGLAMIVFLL